ncbi:MAG: hypothetical protein HWE21_07865 [Cytophagia bacterium]|nr:hypothetical protein [Cytophagia bacterium]
MSANYSIEVQSEYLYVKAVGNYNEEEFLSYPQIVKEACFKHNKKLALFNGLDVKNISLTTISRYDMGMEIVNTIKKEIKVALVWPITYTNYYSQAIAENYGAEFKVFHSDEAALQWLLN